MNPFDCLSPFPEGRGLGVDQTFIALSLTHHRFNFVVGKRHALPLQLGFALLDNPQPRTVSHQAGLAARTAFVGNTQFGAGLGDDRLIQNLSEYRPGSAA